MYVVIFNYTIILFLTLMAFKCSKTKIWMYQFSSVSQPFYSNWPKWQDLQWIKVVHCIMHGLLLGFLHKKVRIHRNLLMNCQPTNWIVIKAGFFHVTEALVWNYIYILLCINHPTKLGFCCCFLYMKYNVRVWLTQSHPMNSRQTSITENHKFKRVAKLTKKKQGLVFKI